jgi:hypothetical protein
MIQLNEIEARVLGCLVEKSLTTPDLYPLTMNALVNACNQKSSRDPVMSLDEASVGKGLHSLLEQGYAGRVHEAGSRVPKFMHHIEIMLNGADAKVIGAVCVLLLRGPQTPGEIKSRTDRLCEFTSSAEVESLLQDLAAKPEPWVAKLSRQTGQKELRYRHLFSGVAPEHAPMPVEVSVPAPKAPTPADDRLAQLEKRVAALEELVKKLAPVG